MSGSTPEADNDELREWKKTWEEKFCPMRYDPTALPLPLLRCAIDPLAWVGKRIWANPVTASGKRSPHSSIETIASLVAGEELLPISFLRLISSPYTPNDSSAVSMSLIPMNGTSIPPPP